MELFIKSNGDATDEEAKLYTDVATTQTTLKSSAQSTAERQTKGSGTQTTDGIGKFSIKWDANNKDFTIVPVRGRKATEEENKLFQDIESTKTTLNAIAASDKSALARHNTDGTYYINKLFQIARLGLEEPDQSTFGAFMLRSFQNDVLRREGGRCKNKYMMSLGLWTILFAGVPLIMYFALPLVGAVYQDLKPTQNFLVLWIGAMIGCWLSFGIRNVEVTFAALGAPESDLLQPIVRLIFTGLLAVTLGVLFTTGMVNLEIGGLKTVDLLVSPAIALAIGLFCGIAEKTLSSTIGSRASGFMGQINK
jgi:hypothetical protein